MIGNLWHRLVVLWAILVLNGLVSMCSKLRSLFKIRSCRVKCKDTVALYHRATKKIAKYKTEINSLRCNRFEYLGYLIIESVEDTKDILGENAPMEMGYAVDSEQSKEIL